MASSVRNLPRRDQITRLLILIVTLHGPFANCIAAFEQAGSSIESNSVADAPGSYLQIVGDYLYIAGFGHGFHVLEISNPAHPKWIGGWNNVTCPVGVQVVGRYAYLANRTSGLDILDVQDPRSPAQVGHLFTGGDAFSIHVVGHHAYLADGPKGLQVLDVSDPTKPKLVSQNDTQGRANSVQVVDGLAYVACANARMRIFDVGNPVKPVQIGQVTTRAGGLGNVQVVGDFVYYADGAQGFHVIDAKERTLPTVHSTFLVGGCNSGMYVLGRRAYVPSYAEGLHIIDVNDPDKLHSVGFFKTSYCNQDVRVAGKYAYLMDRGATVHVIDLGDLANPKEVGAFNPRDYPSRILALTAARVISASEAQSILQAHEKLGAITNAPPELTNPRRTDDGHFAFTLRGIPEGRYFIEASTNLVSWVAISTNTLPASGTGEISDPASGSFVQRYYRAIKKQ